jgi:hypothetical protein
LRKFTQKKRKETLGGVCACYPQIGGFSLKYWIEKHQPNKLKWMGIIDHSHALQVVVLNSQGAPLGILEKSAYLMHDLV